MRLSFRLAQLAGYDPSPNRRSGIIKKISDYTGIYRHKVRDLLKGDFQSVKLEDLGRVCQYLIDQCDYPAARLPADLFGVEPESFWEQLACRERLEICYGVRRDEGAAERSWVMASDALLFGGLLRGVSRAGQRLARPVEFDEEEDSPADGMLGGDGTAELALALAGGLAGGKPSAAPTALNHVIQSLVKAPRLHEGYDLREREPDVVEMAEHVYGEFTRFRGSKALVCLGSMKSNPLCDLVLGGAFEVTPYVSQDEVRDVADRRCPIFLRYRAEDPHPSSCAGGLQLAKGRRSEEPGIWYETASGEWQCVPCRKGQLDAALVFYINRPAQGRLEMVLGGYSGVATRLLAQTLADDAATFWSPVEVAGAQIGAFLVGYELGEEEVDDQAFLSTPPVKSRTIIPLSGEVLARRFMAAAEEAERIAEAAV